VVWPDKLRKDIGAHYDGSSNPVEFLHLYVVAIQAACGDQCVMANWFPMALKDAPRTWLMNLPHESVTSWKDLCRQFIANFMPTYKRPATKNNLKVVHEYKGETLRQYIQCFSQMRNKIPRIANEEVISAFSTGVADIKMKEKLSMNDELTSVVRLLEIANRCAKAEEGRLFMHNLPEALPPKPQSKDPKRKEAAALATEPDHKQHHGDRSECDMGGRHRYCILHKKDTHNTDDCWVVQKFMKRMESPSIAGVAVAMAKVDQGATTATTIRTRVAAVMVRHMQIPSRYRCLRSQTITEKRTRGAIKSREASPLASWEEPKLLCLIATSSSCRGRSRQHSPTSTATG
jgi:hypothetical protein